LVPDTVHTPGSLEGSTENTTGLPDPPPVADKVADPPTKADVGGVKEIDWARLGALPIVIVCWAWAAAA
jgi:hypothetical protein